MYMGCVSEIETSPCARPETNLVNCEPILKDWRALSTAITLLCFGYCRFSFLFFSSSRLTESQNLKWKKKESKNFESLLQGAKYKLILTIFLEIVKIFRMPCTSDGSWHGITDAERPRLTLFRYNAVFLKPVINVVFWKLFYHAYSRGIFWKKIPKRVFVHLPSQWRSIDWQFSWA